MSQFKGFSTDDCNHQCLAGRPFILQVETLSNVMTFDDVDAADIHADRQNMSALST